MGKVIIIGGGASGMMAGVILGRHGREVIILEKNEKLGKKLYITGKGRCNLTNACEPDALMQAVVSNPRFLYSAFALCPPERVMLFFEEAGLSLKTERGNRVFPTSDHASDVIRTLERELRKVNAEIRLHTRVAELLVRDGRAAGVILENGTRLVGDAVLVATGGLSYPSTGSTGDGYRFAQETGHKVTDLTPSLVPLTTAEDYIGEMAGLSLKNTGLTIRQHKKILYEDFGEMMFTHTGVTGPMILSASSRTAKALKKGPLSATLNLKPALSEEQLDKRILRDFNAGPNRQFRNAVGSLFPASLTPVILRLSGIPLDKPVHAITKQERLAFEQLIRQFPFTITGTGSFREAVITQGGVSIKDVHPSTMESKKLPGLFFIGEVLDLDAVTGGFNLQIAWATAWTAGQALAAMSDGKQDDERNQIWG